MDFKEMSESKDLHDRRVLKFRETGSYPVIDTNTLSGCLNRMRRRGGTLYSKDVMQESFETALDTSDGVEIFTVFEEGDQEESRVIVKNLKDNWQQDTKYINAPLGRGFVTGNTVTWKRLGIKWLLVWQDFNMKGFYRGEMYRANYTISWRLPGGKVCTQWASIRGPVETKAKYDNVGGQYMGGRQNDTLDIWIGYNSKEEVDALKRFGRIKVGSRTWEITVRDDISNPNVLRMSCIEDFNNKFTDDTLNAIPGGQKLIPEGSSDLDEIMFIGDHYLKTGMEATYVAKNQDQEVIEGVYQVLNSEEEILKEEQGYGITVKGTKPKDRLTLRLYVEGELKAESYITVTSLF